MRYRYRAFGAALGVALTLATVGQAQAADSTPSAILTDTVSDTRAGLDAPTQADPIAAVNVPALADPVTVTITGTVKAKLDSVPLVGACVTAFLVTAQTEIATGCTDATGTYTLSYLGNPEERVKLRATAAGYGVLWSGTRPTWAEATSVHPANPLSTLPNFLLYTGAGTVTGRVVDIDNAPVVDAKVWVSANVFFAFPTAWMGTAYTDADGRYTLSDVPPGRYLVRISGPNVASSGYQYLPQQRLAADAAYFTVADGQQTVINEVFLRGAGLEVTVVNEDGTPVAYGTCVRADIDHATSAASTRCTGATNQVPLDLPRPAGSSRTNVTVAAADGRLHRAVATDVPLWTHTMTKITVVMRPVGALTTYAVDATTGSRITTPFCLHVQRPNDGGLRLASTTSTTVPGERADQRTFCAVDGSVVVGPLEPGDVQLFATVGDNYGAQWVGADGGTGDRRQAATFHLTAGQSITIPPIRFDRAGVITGTIRDAAGQPVVSDIRAFQVCAHPYAVDLREDVSTPAQQCNDGTGQYTVTGLGPYEWPLQFVSSGGHWAQIWSGGANNRLNAAMIKVVAGQTARADVGGAVAPVIAGTTTDATGNWSAENAWFEAFDAITGDQLLRSLQDPNPYLGGLPANRPVLLSFWSESNPALKCAYSVVNRLGVTTTPTLGVGTQGIDGLNFRYYQGCPPPVQLKPSVDPRNP